MVMNGQTTLTENPPLILDATCSYTTIWPKFATIRIDIRPRVKPDLVMDARKTSFPDQYFDEIYCDPPHIIDVRISSKSSPQGQKMKERYGYWSHPREWKEFIQATNIEFARILKPDGVLHYKIVDGKWWGMTKLKDLLEGMTNFTVIKDRVTPSGGSKNNKTHWLTMKPKPP